MKRSQMIERIYDMLNCDGVLEYSMPQTEAVPLTEEHVRWIAGEILKEVEEAGMQPPLVPENTVETKVIMAMPMGWQELRTENSTVFISKWEDETDS